MNVTPIKNRVFIYRHPQETMKNGIILPDTENQPAQYGTVKAIGSGVEDVRVGDMVFFSKYVDIPFDDNHFFIMDKDILAVIES